MLMNRGLCLSTFALDLPHGRIITDLYPCHRRLELMYWGRLYQRRLA